METLEDFKKFAKCYFKDFEEMENNDEIKKLVNSLTNNHKYILSIEDAQKLGLHKGPGNGSGDRKKITKMYINTTIYGSCRSPMTYPKCYDEHIELTLDDLKMIEEYKKKREEDGIKNSQGVIGFIIRGDNIYEKINRPIHSDIKKYYSQYPCVKCGAKKTICDHKNDLYNDPRVLDINTQTKEDFQPLCNSCNLRKRACGLRRDKENKRQPPSPDILAMNGGIKFTKGNENYDTNDKNALIGSYWYDPIQFAIDCRKIMLLEKSEE
tara:strand:+ start:349 stop:1149 length:801 start_codon:yes stop_codon:yes gene_type:complete